MYVNKAFDYALSHSTGRGVSLGGKLYRILLGLPRSYVEVSNLAHHPEMNQGENIDNGQNSIEGFHNHIHVRTVMLAEGMCFFALSTDPHAGAGWIRPWRRSDGPHGPE